MNRPIRTQAVSIPTLVNLAFALPVSIPVALSIAKPSTVAAYDAATVATPSTAAAFRKTTVHSLYLGEGVDAGDFNKDGVLDIVNGPYWFQGPDFRQRHLYAPVAPPGRDVSQGWELGLANAPWGNHVFDWNGDGWDDIMILERLESTAYWYENPKGAGGMWKRHVARSAIGHESRHIADIQGDARPEFLGSSKDSLAWFESDPRNPTARWPLRLIGRGDFEFGHGLGIGDVDGDGRMDALCATGWYKQPAQASSPWTFHAQDFKSATPAPRVSSKLNGGSHMYAYDVDGDGLNDVVTALNAHGWGLAWFKQVRESGRIGFERRMIMGDSTERDRYGAAFSQLHSVALADVDGDGLKDIVTGKTWWAHPPDWGDPDGTGSPVLYVFKLVREAGGARFIPHRLDDRSGVGRHILVRDITGDGRPDIVTGNKGGLYVFQQTPPVGLAFPGRAIQAGPIGARSRPGALTLLRSQSGALGLLAVEPDAFVLTPDALPVSARNVLGIRVRPGSVPAAP